MPPSYRYSKRKKEKKLDRVVRNKGISKMVAIRLDVASCLLTLLSSIFKFIFHFSIKKNP